MARLAEAEGRRSATVAVDWQVCEPYSLVSARPAAFMKAQRHVSIAEAAYFLAQKRGFAPGHELDDWLRAEQQVDTCLATEFGAI